MITAAQLRAARVLLGIDQRRLAELSGLSVPTIQRMEASETMIRGNVDSLENQQRLGSQPFFIGGCHSWRTDGPVVAAMFPLFATKPAAKD